MYVHSPDFFGSCVRNEGLGVRGRGGNARGKKQWRLRDEAKGVSEKRRVNG